MTADQLQSIIPRLGNHRVLVVGDLILDEYVVGQAQRLSREAPIPVLEFESRQYIPGGAANPAVNIAGMGSSALQVGVIGSDDAADHLRDRLEQQGVDTSLLVIDPGKPTTLKTRIMAQMGFRFPQQVARIDTVSREPISRMIEAAVLQQIQRNLAGVDAVLFSDYHNGLLTSSLLTPLKQIALGTSVPLIVDAQGSLEKYSGCHVVKCNADDAAAYLGRRLTSDDDFAAAARELASVLNVRVALVITRGSNGATIAHNEQVNHFPSPAVSDVYDTVGAGDTWIALMTLALVADAAVDEAVQLANYASGIVVRHVGNYAPSPAELMQAIEAGL